MGVGVEEQVCMCVCLCVWVCVLWRSLIDASLGKSMDYYISISTLHMWTDEPLWGTPTPLTSASPSPSHHPSSTLQKLTSFSTFHSLSHDIVFATVGQIISKSTFNIFFVCFFCFLMRFRLYQNETLKPHKAPNCLQFHEIIYSSSQYLSTYHPLPAPLLLSSV